MSFTSGIVLSVAAFLGGSTTPISAHAVIMPKAQTVQEYVQNYFADAPIMAEIAKCESHSQQYGKDGQVVKNPNSSAVGLFQIMSSIHADFADDKLGLDIYTTQGNAAYARYLYDTQGTVPWNASKACWGKTTAAKALQASSTLAIR